MTLSAEELALLQFGVEAFLRNNIHSTEAHTLLVPSNMIELESLLRPTPRAPITKPFNGFLLSALVSFPQVIPNVIWVRIRHGTKASQPRGYVNSCFSGPGANRTPVIPLTAEG